MTKRYYIYEPLTEKIGLFKGKVVDVEDILVPDYDPENPEYVDGPVPDNSSLFKPAENTNPDYAVYFYNGNWYVAPKQGTAVALQKYSQMLSLSASASVDQIDSPYPPMERETFEQQRRDAEDYIATGKVTPLLTKLAKAQGRDVSELAQRVIERVTARNDALIDALADYQFRRRQLDKGNTTDLPLCYLLGLLQE